MRILLVFTLTVGVLSLTGCMGNSDPVTDTLAQTPFMYKSEVQQGNVITQEQVNKLEPGMNKSQVRYIMGTPMLVDTFHQDRWDYLYTFRKDGRLREKKRVSLLFKDDLLVSIDGDLRPEPGGGSTEKETVVSVPDNRERTGIVSGALQAVGLKDNGRPKPKAEEKAKEATTTPAPEETGSEQPAPGQDPEQAADAGVQTPAE
ncbi:MAG: outer membrane protein assembly factor BamE [Gammaproteobacteria bacterium]|nr:outer membrane protein assembly factor BamE [Gammaproteobacteria bacterium]MBU1654159.1 outer membrane protein assembly factor BamE [Gammaproteobacteria bacterium]MBU1960799.1 outer membrane protein assembly factor BamE [Gammaproteobacteria bacterium]